MSWQVFVPCRIRSLNEESAKSWQWRSRVRGECRQAAAAIGYQAVREGKLPRLCDVPLQIIVQPYEYTRRLLDAGNCMTVAKGVIDGLRDAKALIDDSPRHVRAVTYLAGIRVANETEQGLLVILREWKT